MASRIRGTDIFAARNSIVLWIAALTLLGGIGFVLTYHLVHAGQGPLSLAKTEPSVDAKPIRTTPR